MFLAFPVPATNVRFSARHAPLLRKANKEKDDREKTFSNVLLGIVVGLAIALLFGGGPRSCADSSYDSPRRYYRR